MKMGDLPLQNNPKYRQGHYHPVNPQKAVGKLPFVYRSGLELKYFMQFDQSPNVKRWGSESITIPYMFAGGMHNYYIDLIAEMVDGTKYLIEVKPMRQTQAPVATPRKRKKTLLTEQVTYAKNTAKWAAAREFADKYGMKFVILTENNKNVGG